MNDYLEPTDKDAFLDFPDKEINRKQSEPYGHTYECPQCQGYGGWNLRLNAYPLREKSDTPENRHKFSHFRASCNHCMGWGYVTKEETNHIHNWKFEVNLGNCYNRYRCNICNQKWDCDSSD